MRFALLLLLFPIAAAADVRLGVHATGGLEAGTMSGAPHPAGIVEAGVSATFIVPERSWGFGLMLETVRRASAGADSIAEERKLDVLVRVADTRRFRVGVGAGVRRMTIAGGRNRPSSTLDGYDIVRLTSEITFARAGPVSLDFVFGWTFGLYSGVVYGERHGDMPYPEYDETTITTSYVAGVQTSFAWR